MPSCQRQGEAKPQTDPRLCRCRATLRASSSRTEETMALAAPSSLRRLPARSPPAASLLRSRPLREPRLRLRQPLVAAAAAATAPLAASSSPVRSPRAPPPLARQNRHSVTLSSLAGGHGAEEARAAALGSGNAARVRGGARPACRHRGGHRTYDSLLNPSRDTSCARATRRR